MSLGNNPRPSELLGPTTDGTFWSETATGTDVADTPSNGEKQSGVADGATYTSARHNWLVRLTDKWIRHLQEYLDVEHNSSTGGHKASTFTSASAGDVKIDITGHASDNTSTTNQIRLRNSALTTIFTVTLAKLTHLVGNFGTQVETPKVSTQNATGSPTTLSLDAYNASGTGTVKVYNNGTGNVAQLNIQSGSDITTINGTTMTTGVVRAGTISIQAVATTPTALTLDAYRLSALSTVDVINSGLGGTVKMTVTGDMEVSRVKVSTNTRVFSYPAQGFNGDSVSGPVWRKPGSSSTPSASAGYAYIDEASSTSYFVDMPLQNLQVGDVITEMDFLVDRAAGGASCYLCSQETGSRTIEATAAVLSGTGNTLGTSGTISVTVAIDKAYFLCLEVANGGVSGDIKARRVRLNVTRNYL